MYYNIKLKLLLACILTLCSNLTAANLSFNHVEDLKTNQLFNKLGEFKNSPQELSQLHATAKAADSLLRHKSEEIKGQTDYTGLFTGNCSIFFNEKIEQVSCNINPTSPQNLSASAEFETGKTLPEKYSSQIYQSNILLVNIFADWTGKKSQEFETDLYFKQSPCSASDSSTLSLSEILTKTMAFTLSKTASPSRSIDKSESARSSTSESSSIPLPPAPTNTLASSTTHSGSLTNSATNSASQSVSNSDLKTLSNSMQTASHTRSLTNSFPHSQTNSGSLSVSPTLTNSASQSLQATKSPTSTLKNTNTATKSLGSTSTKSPSSTLSSSGSDSHSPISTPTQSFTLEPTKTLITVSEWARWPASSGIYSNSASQVSRYSSSAGVVTDSYSNLQWEQATSSSTYAWSAASAPGSAQDYCSNQTTGGFNDWRLPTAEEFHTLVDYTNFSPAIDSTTFPGTLALGFWSSTPYKPNPTEAWYLNFESGSVLSNSISTAYYVRCVRFGIVSINNTSIGRYKDENGNTLIPGSTQVKDMVTGLIWERSVASGPRVWSPTSVSGSAQWYCGSHLSLGGHTWRMPTAKEFRTLVDAQKSNPAIDDINAFSSGSDSSYWTATDFHTGATYAWELNLGDGSIEKKFRTQTKPVRCVR